MAFGFGRSPSNFTLPEREAVPKRFAETGVCLAVSDTTMEESLGVVAIISFHSLEDRIVKQRMREWAQMGTMAILTKKVVMAGPREVSINPRSRSAKLRAVERGNKS